MRLTLIIIMSALLQTLAAQEMSINEFMAINNETIQDEDGDYSDWLELYNSSETPIDISGWYISDDADEPLKWQIGARELAANEHLLVFASSKDRSGAGELHCNFKISSEGEFLILSRNDGSLVQFISPIALSDDISYGSAIDGAINDQVFFGPSSPGMSNQLGEVIDFANDEIEFSIEAGFYAEQFDLALSSLQGAEIRYTRDGSEPKATSTLYSGPINIGDRQEEPNDISIIPSGKNWESPRTSVEKATVIKAASFSDNARVTPVHTATYFVSERIQEKYAGLPVISLSTDPDSLFDEDRGIYLLGTTADGNYNQKGRDWERAMHFEYFDENHTLQVAQQVGARIHGKSSRSHPQKSLRLYARDSYGDSELSYPFFDAKPLDDFRRIIIRSSSTDYGNTMFRDILCSRLAGELDLDYMADKVCIVFINGEYWGVSSLRERIDEHYLAQNHGVDSDSLDLLTVNAEVEVGDRLSYDALLDYVRQHDLSIDEHYSYVSSQVDIANYIDYNIAQLYFGNIDWPFVNIRYWKGKGPASKWRWIFHDSDRSMLIQDSDQLSDYLLLDAQYNSSPEWTTVLFNSLIQHEDFKQQFVQRFFYLMNTTLRSEHILSEIDALEFLYAPLMGDHIDRWSYPPSHSIWAASLSDLRAYVVKRPAVVMKQVLELLGEQYSIYPNPARQGVDYVQLDMSLTADVATSIEVYNVQGQLVQSQALNPHADLQESPRISIRNLKPGVYIVRIYYGVLVFSEKLVLE